MRARDDSLFAACVRRLLSTPLIQIKSLGQYAGRYQTHEPTNISGSVWFSIARMRCSQATTKTPAAIPTNASTTSYPGTSKACQAEIQVWRSNRLRHLSSWTSRRTARSSGPSPPPAIARRDGYPGASCAPCSNPSSACHTNSRRRPKKTRAPGPVPATRIPKRVFSYVDFFSVAPVPCRRELAGDCVARFPCSQCP